MFLRGQGNTCAHLKKAAQSVPVTVKVLLNLPHRFLPAIPVGSLTVNNLDLQRGATV